MIQDSLQLTDRSLIHLTGGDVFPFLERLVTHNVADWSPGDMRFGALLTPQGKILADYRAYAYGGGILLDVHNSAAEAFAKRLKMFRLRADVAIDAREDLCVVAHWGESAAAQGDVFKDSRAGSPFSFQIVAGQANAQASALVAYNRVRIAAILPEMGADFATASLFPADVKMDLLGGVALKKGCFVGQEVVSRMHRRGTIRKRTACLSFTPLDGGPVTAETSVMGGVSTIGSILTSSGGTALAVIRLDRLAAAQDKGADITVLEQSVALTLPDSVTV